jgi:hypothetical protein
MPARDPWDDLRRRVVRPTEAETGDLDEGPRDDGCAECGLPVGADGRVFSDGVGGLVGFCRTCAAAEFPLR